MSPKRAIPKTPVPVSPDQGEMFGVSTHAGMSYMTEPKSLEEDAAPEIQVSAEPETLVAQTTDVRTRAAHLVTSLNLLARANKSRGFQTAGQPDHDRRPELEARYGEEGLAHALGESMHSKNSVLVGARDAFHSAYEKGSGTVSKDNPEFMAAWAAFYRKFNGTGHRKARDAQRNKYKKLEAMEGEAQPGDTYVIEQPAALTKLSKQEKLNVFEQDERLQFYPATDKEEEQARRALNYIDEPHGVLNMLDEISRHNVKAAFKRGENETQAIRSGNVARHSVLHEMGDHLYNALTQIDHLTDLEDKLAGLNSKLTIAEAVGGDHPAFAALVRDVDYETFRIGGKKALGFNPLSTKEDRRPHDQPGKNKTIEDVYTGAASQTVEAREEIDAWKHDMTVGELFSSGRLQATKARQSERASFFLGVFGKTEGSDKRVAREILEHRGLVLDNLQ